MPLSVLPELPLPLRRGIGDRPLAGAPAATEVGVSTSWRFGGRSPEAAREEVLEELWTSYERGRPPTIAALASTIHAGASDGWGGVVQELVELAWIDVAGDVLSLTTAGAQEARTVVRRHRLAEVLFFQVLELPMDTTEDEACTWEHVLSPQTTDAVCSFLGHPPACPHGRPIPPGPCCTSLSRHVDSLICRLLDLAPGERGRVVLVAPRHMDRLEQLTDLGVSPGAVLTLRQRKPSFVIEVDRTLLAVEESIAANIYLRPLREW
jgi:DtxR family transcriptional regulator, Mn-dependent transcriptional regulator